MMIYCIELIAKQIEQTALGEAFHGNALRVAKDIPGVTGEDRFLLDKFLTGMNEGTDHVGLQQIATKIRGLK